MKDKIDNTISKYINDALKVREYFISEAIEDKEFLNKYMLVEQRFPNKFCLSVVDKSDQQKQSEITVLLDHHPVVIALRKEIQELEQECKRLRDALEKISVSPSECAGNCKECEECDGHIAWEALEGKCK